MSRFPSSPHLFAALAVFVGAACESPAAPAPCGPLPQVTVNVGERSSVAACFNDENGDVLSYTATSSNPAVAKASISDTSITVTGVAPGDATVDASQYFSEPDGEALTYAASASDTAVASVSVAGSTITVTAKAKGGATITTTASDPGGLSATQTFGVTVPNRAPKPVGAIDAQTIKVGQPVLFDVASAFADPDGDSLTYTVATPDDSVVFTIVTLDSELLLHGLAVGTTTLTVTAQDPDGLTATQSFVLTVAPALTRLTFHSETDASPDWSQDGTRIAFHSDRDGNDEIYVMQIKLRENLNAQTGIQFNMWRWLWWGDPIRHKGETEPTAARTREPGPPLGIERAVPSPVPASSRAFVWRTRPSFEASRRIMPMPRTSRAHATNHA